MKLSGKYAQLIMSFLSVSLIFNAFWFSNPQYSIFNRQCLSAYPFLNSSPFKNRPFLSASSAFPFPVR